MDKERSFISTALFAVLASVCTVSAAPAASAQSLKSMRAQQAEQSALNSEIAYTNSVCGGTIKASINWSTAADWPENQSLAAACDGALGALEAICRAPGGKDKGAQISSFVCAGDGGGPSLSGGTLSYGASVGENGFADTKDYLEDAL